MPDIFENFRKMCSKIYELDLEKFLSAPRLPWKASLKRLRTIKRHSYIINGCKKKLEEEYVTLLIDMQKLIKNIWKSMNKMMDHHI